MKNLKIFVILFELFLVIVGSPLNKNHDETISRLSDIGMHPHIYQNSHAEHKKVKRAASFQISDDEFTNKYWMESAKKSVESKVKQAFNNKRAKNVIFFLGDGLSHTSIAAARVLKAGESAQLSFESFPYTANSKTYCVDETVADSACSGTAFLHGIKTNMGVIGLNGLTKRGNCNDTDNEENFTLSIASWFLEDGRNAGIVTTTRITDATPAAVYANIAERNWEGNQQVINSKCDHSNIYDIAEQAIRGRVGSNLKVILGGGSKNFINTTDIEHGSKGSRTDGKNLINDWLDSGSKRKFVRNREELMDIDVKKVDQLFGLFHSDHMPYHLETVMKSEQSIYPTLTEMTMKAIDVLTNDDDGYFLLVEGGRIDHAHHANQARLALDEVLEFSNAIKAVVDKVNLDETLIVVTADHSHVMTVAGYSPRGTDIFSAPKKADDNLNYFIISYANGPGYSTHLHKGIRANPKELDTSPIDFRFPATIPLKSETHAGEDVGIWAIGPNAHLFKGTIEQNLIAHIMAYASCVGKGLTVCN